MKCHLSSSLPQLNLIPPLPKNPRCLPIISIGAGAIVALAHLLAYKLAGFCVKAIYDIDRQKALDLAKKRDIPQVYNTINEACIASKEIVPILKQIPINSHALIQKLMGENLVDAQSIVNICKQRNIHGSINFQLRYAPYIFSLKDAIHRGWLG
jgi:predicted dehydrogenase